MNKDWIKVRDRFSEEYIKGVAQFLEVAKCHLNEAGKTRCPCKNCLNSISQSLDGIERHLFVSGISPLYTQWVYHGEPANLARFQKDTSSPVDDELSTKCNAQNEDDKMFGLQNDLQGPMIGEGDVDEEEDFGEQKQDTLNAIHEDGVPVVGSSTEALGSRSHSTRGRRTRGHSRNIQLDRYINAHGRIKIEIDKKVGKPVCGFATKFSGAIGAITRDTVPLRYATWKVVPKEVLDNVKDQLLTYFDFDVSNKSMGKYLERKMQSMFKEYRAELYKHYCEFRDPTKARAHPPTRITSPDDWNLLCNRWETPEWKKKTETNKKSRSNLPFNHRAGKKSFAQLQNELKLKESRDVDKVDLFCDKDGWVNDNGKDAYQPTFSERAATIHSERRRSTVERRQGASGGSGNRRRKSGDDKESVAEFGIMVRPGQELEALNAVREIDIPMSCSSTEASRSTSRVRKRGRWRGRGTRGHSRNLDLERHVTAHGKIKIELDEKAGKPVCRFASMFSGAVGTIVRDTIPLHCATWSTVPKNVRDTVKDRLLTYFDFDYSKYVVKKYLERKMQTTFKEYRAELYKYYVDFEDPTKVRETPHKRVTKLDDWNLLCDRWETPEWKEKTERNKASRSKLPYNHRAGKKSFVQLQNELKIQENREIDPVDLFHESHYREVGGWVNDNARDRYLEMQKVLEESSQEGAKSIDGAEVSKLVLGHQSGHIKGLGSDSNLISSKCHIFLTD